MKTIIARHLTCVLLLAVCSLSAAGQLRGAEKLSPTLRRAMTLDQRAHRAPTAAAMDTLLAFVRTQLGADALEPLGCRVVDSRAGIAVVALPPGALPALMARADVARIECEPAGSVALDSVARYVRSAQAHQGRAPLTQAFTGRGVVVGMVDAGLDMSHPTFSTPQGGLRIARFWDQLARRSTHPDGGRSYADTAAMRRLGHARAALYMNHATHVLGIAGGTGYGGHYEGLAPQATLCAVDAWVSNLAPWLGDSVPRAMQSATATALAFKYIFDFAAEQGRPCVINYSVSTPMTFFDDNRLWLDYVSALTGPGRIVVASAGNSGNAFMHVAVPADAPPTGGTAFYCNAQRAPLFSMSLTGVQGHDVALDVYANMYAPRPDTSLVLPLSRLGAGVRADSFCLALGGGRAIYGADSLLSSPYVAGDTVVYLELRTPDLAPFGGHEQWPVYALRLGPDLQGRAVSIYQHNFTTYPQFLTQAGLRLEYIDHGYTLSAHTMSDSVISVGASAERLSYTDLQGHSHSFEVDSVYPARAYWSSMGPTLNGLTKPDCVAPGTYVVSASSACLLHTSGVGYPTARDIMDSCRVGGRTYHWIQMSGTSMSAPVVTGTIALWLEACPTLGPADVRRLLARTARPIDPAVTAYPNNAYGYGEVDAYRGLLSLLGLDEAVGTGRVSAEQPRGVTFALHGRRLSIDGLSGPTAVRVYTTDGRLCRTLTARPGAPIDLSGLPAGVYAVQLEAAASRRAGSTLVRLAR